MIQNKEHFSDDYDNGLDIFDEDGPTIYIYPPEYIASRSLVDTLKLELEALSPAESKVMQSIVKKFVKTLTQQYSSHMSEYAQKRLVDVDSRIVTIASEKMQIVHGGLWSLGLENFSDIPTGWLSETGNIVFLKHISEAMSQTMFRDEDHLQEFIKRENIAAKSEAISIAAQWAMQGVLAHEIAHSAQDYSVPYYFDECGAYYYGKELATKNDIPPLVLGPMGRMLVEIYEGLLNLHGDEVHKLFFGSLEDQNKRQGILMDCRYMSDDIF